MSNLCVVTSRHLIPAIKTAHQAIDKAKTNPKIICALNRTLETLKVAEFQMQRTQTDNAESGQPGCLFFETATRSKIKILRKPKTIKISAYIICWSSV